MAILPKERKKNVIPSLPLWNEKNLQKNDLVVKYRKKNNGKQSRGHIIFLKKSSCHNCKASMMWALCFQNFSWLSTTIYEGKKKLMQIDLCIVIKAKIISYYLLVYLKKIRI